MSHPRDDATSRILTALYRMPDEDRIALAWLAERLPYATLLEHARSSASVGIGAKESPPSTPNAWALRCAREAWAAIREVTGAPVGARGSVHRSLTGG